MTKSSPPRPPLRLVDDPSVAAELRTDVERAANASSVYDAAAGLAVFQAVIGAEVIAAGGSAAGAHASATHGAGVLATTCAKLGVAAAGTIALVVGSVTLSHRTATDSPSRPTQHATYEAPSVPSDVVPSQNAPSQNVPRDVAPSARTPSAPPIDNDLDALELAPPALRRAPRSRQAEVTAPAAPSEGLRRETDQLARIRAALHAGEARDAYQLAQAGHAEFDPGESMLWHEREALAILALFELGRDPEGSRRARALLARFPGSTFRAELEARLGGSKPSEDLAPD
jgi:hypothetical protein